MVISPHVDGEIKVHWIMNLTLRPEGIFVSPKTLLQI